MASIRNYRDLKVWEGRRNFSSGIPTSLQTVNLAPNT